MGGCIATSPSDQVWLDERNCIRIAALLRGPNPRIPKRRDVSNRDCDSPQNEALARVASSGIFPPSPSPYPDPAMFSKREKLFQAFTLIELLVVIAIIAILAAM